MKNTKEPLWDERFYYPAARRRQEEREAREEELDKKDHNDAAHRELKRKIQSGLNSGVSPRAIHEIFDDVRKKLNV